MAQQSPTVGRVVHYQSYGTPGREYLPEPRAAIVTEVQVVSVGGLMSAGKREVTHVSLCVLNPEGMFFNRDVPYSDEPKPGHWNWPPRG